MTTARILTPALADYAKELLAAGFKVYVFTSDISRVAKGGREQVAKSFKFSREVDGQTCYGSVAAGYFGSAEFSMPIRPSTKNGSSMFIGGAEQKGEALDVATAEKYASPTGYNHLVGIQQNYGDARFAHLYTEVAE